MLLIIFGCRPEACGMALLYPVPTEPILSDTVVMSDVLPGLGAGREPEAKHWLTEHLGS